MRKGCKFACAIFEGVAMMARCQCFSQDTTPKQECLKYPLDADATLYTLRATPHSCIGSLQVYVAASTPLSPFSVSRFITRNQLGPSLVCPSFVLQSPSILPEPRFNFIIQFSLKTSSWFN